MAKLPTLSCKPTTPYNASFRSDEGLTLETSAFFNFHGGNSTLKGLGHAVDGHFVLFC